MSGLELFWSLLQASTLSLGAQTALPLLRQQLVGGGILGDRQIIEALAIGRLGTGPGGLFIVSLGYFALGWPGAAIALVAITLPPLVIVPAASTLRRQLLSTPFAGALRGLALCTSGLVLPTTVGLVMPGTTDGVNTWWQAALLVGGVWMGIEGKRHPALVIAIGAVAGVVFSR
jgi:chromate transporter